MAEPSLPSPSGVDGVAPLTPLACALISPLVWRDVAAQARQVAATDELVRPDLAATLWGLEVAARLGPRYRQWLAGQRLAARGHVDMPDVAVVGGSPEWITVDRASVLLRRSGRTVRRWCAVGRLDARQAYGGGPWLVRRESAELLAA